MASILDSGSEHLPGVLSGNPESLRALFDARLAGWGKPYSHEECHTVGLFDDVEREVESHVAFALIESAVGLALSQQDEAALLCAVSLIRGLVAATHTTEVPRSLMDAYPELLERSHALSANEVTSQLDELSRHYRHAL